MDKIKYLLSSNTGKDIFTVLIVVLVGLGSFGLGRLSKQAINEGLKVEYNGKLVEGEAAAIKSVAEAPIEPIRTGGQFFASSKGSKYYPVGCAAGKSLKQENRIYFDTREAAETAGYQLSSSCR